MDSILGWLGGKAVEKVLDKLKDDNKYPDLGGKGILLTYMEKQPIIKQLLESLGPNRGKLIEAVLSENAAVRVCATFFLGERLRADQFVHPEEQAQNTPNRSTS